MDFTGWTCEQLLAFINDPANSAFDKASAQSIWETQCNSGGTGTGGQSGGGPHSPPKGG